MEGFKEVMLKEIWHDEGSISHIFVSGNNIYVLGNISLESPVMVEELEAVKEELFEQGHDLINVVSSDSMTAYYVTKAGSEAEALLGGDIADYFDGRNGEIAAYLEGSE